MACPLLHSCPTVVMHLDDSSESENRGSAGDCVWSFLFPTSSVLADTCPKSLISRRLALLRLDVWLHLESQQKDTAMQQGLTAFMHFRECKNRGLNNASFYGASIEDQTAKG